MNICKILLINILLIITLNVSAQKHKTDTFVLNDGSRITGTIIADSAGFLKLKIEKPRIIILNKSQISAPVEPGLTRISDQHGYYLHFSGSLLAGHNSVGNTGNLSMQIINAYRFRNGLSIGIGTGIEKFDVLVIPAYADLRYYPLKKSVSPFIRVSGGYGFPCSNPARDYNSVYYYYNNTTGGMMFSAGAGIAIWSRPRGAVTAGIGYRYQRIKSETDNLMIQGTGSELLTDYNRVEIMIGVMFR
jgi:hypothetical protein